MEINHHSKNNYYNIYTKKENDNSGGLAEKINGKI